MNAYELADELKSLSKHYASCMSMYHVGRFENRHPEKTIDNFNQAEKDLNEGFKLLDTMLCQQADRIAELEYKNKILVNRLEVITGVKEITE